MGKYVSCLLCPCFGRDEEKKQYIETNYVTPTPTTIEPVWAIRFSSSIW